MKKWPTRTDPTLPLVLTTIRPTQDTSEWGLVAEAEIVVYGTDFRQNVFVSGFCVWLRKFELGKCSRKPTVKKSLCALPTSLSNLGQAVDTAATLCHTVQTLRV